jgi:hypothetical protein
LAPAMQSGRVFFAPGSKAPSTWIRWRHSSSKVVGVDELGGGVGEHRRQIEHPFIPRLDSGPLIGVISISVQKTGLVAEG